MMQRFILVLILNIFVTTVLSYPDNVPNTAEICKSMTPGHGPKPNSEDSPYQITLSSQEVNSGSNVEVTLEVGEESEESDEERKFKGYYLQARDSNSNPIGQFVRTELTKVHNCGSIKANGAHHANNNDKSSVLITWKSPAQYTGTVTFTASFVENFDNFWTLVQSSPVTIKAA